MQRFRTTAVLFGLAASTLTVAHARETSVSPATGVVFHDSNGNGVRDAGEKGLSGVRVSNQRDVVKTDRDGRYRLPVTDNTILFVVKPSGWMTPLDANNLPRFYYIHKPGGSPAQKFAGVSPTGPLPASVDFPLTPRSEPSRFKVIVFADPQPRNQAEVDYVAHDVVEELVGADAVHGVTLGDIAFNNLDTLRPLNRAIGNIGIPWYNVLGNHDMNFDSVDDTYSTETFQSVYGPPYYSYDYGKAHFVVLDDVVWDGSEDMGRGKGTYTAGLGERQLEFLKNDLALVPKDRLVILMMHIPLNQVAERKEVYRLLEKFPHTTSISGHTHYQEHRFITEADGWSGKAPHHHTVNVTVSGSWWSGATDEWGIPHTQMRDGAPNGYSILTIDGTGYAFAFKAARRPAGHQMSIHAPEEIALADAPETPVYANVFGGSEKSTVEMRLGPLGRWTPMERVREEDPFYATLKTLEAGDNPPNGRKLPDVIKSPHLWKAALPALPPQGTQKIEVRTTDMFGQTYTDSRTIRIR
jgi:hypothetical protein